MTTPKDITPPMLISLQKCYERQLASSSLCNMIDTPGCKGLFTRKMLELRLYKSVDGKDCQGFFVNEVGVTYLKNYSITIIIVHLSLCKN